MTRIKFQKGKQREFLDKVIKNTSSPSLRGLLQFGINTKYSTLKNYYNESRTLSNEIFQELLEISNIEEEELEIKELGENYGKSIGGEISKRNKKGLNVIFL